ncbi:MAG: hypothetical protein QMD80_00940 [archaeon]|nr:hypothetical protein [archaeon]MDI6885423.1 hypothetical protein [archaeon]
MASKFIDAVKCFVKNPACTWRLMRSLGSYDQETLELIKETCPELDIEKLGYYFGLFQAMIFLLLCVMVYLFFDALRMVLLHREMIFPP